MLSTESTAQQANGAELNIHISTEVTDIIELITLREIEIGRVQSGQEHVEINPQTDARAGLMLATGRPEASIRISFIETLELTQSSSGRSIAFTYQVSGNHTDDQATSEFLGAENRDFTFNEEGHFYFWIGGYADISGVPGGQYNGEFTIEIEYN